MSALEYANRFDSLAKPNKANGSSRHLLDANCDYVDGAFRLSCLPPKLPILFTVRFTAPADFTPGDVFTLKGQEYTVRMRSMEEPEGKLFGAGAVVQCDFDMEREIAFFASGGGEAVQSCGCQYQTGDLNFFIDPDGDDSLTNPGTADSPFRTLAGASNAVCQRHILTPLGNLIYNINPGTYELDANDRKAITYATHPQELVFQASDPVNKPLLVGQNFPFERGRRTLANLRLHGNMDVHRNAALILRDIEHIAYSANTWLIHAHSNSLIYFQNSFTVNGDGKTLTSIFSCHGAQMYIHGNATLNVNVQNLPSVTNFVQCNAGHLFLPGIVFTGTTSGRRYHAALGGIINTGGGGANYFPGTVAGTTATGGIYS